MSTMLGIYTIWYRDILRFWRDKMRMLSAITFPLLFLFVFGSGLRGSIGNLGPGVNFTQYMFPGIIAMTVLMSSFTAGISVVWDREFGFLKEVLVAPVSRAAVALGKTLGSATVALVQGMVIMLLSPVIGIEANALTFLKVVPLMLLMAVSLGSLGILLATRIKSMEAFQAVMQLLLFPMIFLSGVFFPLSNLPPWMSFLVKINPATYGVYPLRLVMLGEEAWASFGISLFGHTLTLWEDIFILTLFGGMMLLLAMLSFSHQE